MRLDPTHSDLGGRAYEPGAVTTLTIRTDANLTGETEFAVPASAASGTTVSLVAPSEVSR